ncbi:MAG TPA: CHASE3 domain-containing protein [Xanthobacteraceae bacterium]|nr:CHASE3 domain-containing protein [Xanthobacteraceae bacterium]
MTTVLAALIVAAAFWLSARSKSDDAWVRHSLEVRAQLTRVLSFVQSAETGQRGYLLTGQELYLSPYRMAHDDLPGSLQRTKDLTSDDPQQQQSINHLQDLIGQKLAELKSTLDAYQSGNKDMALAIVNSDNGFQLMLEIRRVVQAMQANEDSVLADRQSLAARSEMLLQAGVAVALVLICGIGFLVARFTRGAFAALTGARDRLALANRQLLDQIARRETAEGQLRQAQKMEALGQLTGGIAHDFNNMLGVIMGALDLVKRRIAKGDYGVERFIDAATIASERAATLTQRLLAFARQQPLSPQPLDANKMIVNMSDLLQSTLGEHIQIETVTAAGLWTVHVDSQQLENAILNIALNGRDAMPDGGKLTIETANAHLDDAYCAQNPEVQPGQFAMIAITDTGVGMPPDVVARAFDPFFTTKTVGKGTGLGLSQVYGFIKQSSGHIKVYSEPGAGTTVKIYLPRLVGDAKEIKRAVAPPTRTGNRNEIILVVEDDPLMRRLASEALHELGYTVFDCDGAANALATLDRVSDVRLLFTDVVMPDVNGKKLADEALRRRPGLKVLFTTGYTANAVVHGGVLDSGVNFITKPFTLDQLAAKVRAILDE